MTPPLAITPFSLAQRFIGIKEMPGLHTSNPLVLAMLQLDAGTAIEDDETAWCSAFVNFDCWLLRLPRSKSLAARSWLGVGLPLATSEGVPGFDVVILKRGEGEQPGPTVLDAPGHVGFLAAPCHPLEKYIYLLGGNQDNMVSVKAFPRERVLGVRRLALV